MKPNSDFIAKLARLEALTQRMERVLEHMRATQAMLTDTRAGFAELRKLVNAERAREGLAKLTFEGER